MGTDRDTDFTNLVEGDEITLIYTVLANGKTATMYKGVRSHGLPLSELKSYDAFVSKRQPRPLKPGDKFTFEHGSDNADIRTIIFIDDESVLYMKDRTGCRNMMPLHEGRNPYYGKIIRAS